MPVYKVARKKPLKLRVLNILSNKDLESQITKDIKNKLRVTGSTTQILKDML